MDIIFKVQNIHYILNYEIIDNNILDINYLNKYIAVKSFI